MDEAEHINLYPAEETDRSRQPNSLPFTKLAGIIYFI